ncbi:MAG: hypothetical protein ACR2QS_00215 [Woeseiaceae bacterium]
MYAQDDFESFNAPWRVYVGVFDASTDSKIRINGDVLPSPLPIDIEDTLRVDDGKLVAWGGIGWHFAKRHSVEFEFFTLGREGTVSDSFSPPLQIGDTFIESGQITTSYDTDVYRLTYGFSMMRSERSDFQLKAGLHIASLSAGIGLAGAICDPTTDPTMPPGCPVAGTGAASESVTAPLPHLGLSYAHALSPNWTLNVSAIGFAVELDNIDGSIVELTGDVAWQPWRNVGVGMGLRYFNVGVESGGSDLNGEFDFEYFGPALYVAVTF